MNTPTDPLDEQIMDILRHPHTKLPKDHVKTYRAINNKVRQEQLSMLLALIHTRERQARVDELNRVPRISYGKKFDIHIRAYLDDRLATLNKEQE